MKTRTIHCFGVALAAFASAVIPADSQWSHKEGDPMPHPPGHLVQPFTQAEWEASNFAAADDVQWFRDAKYGMFIHFGLATHNNAELSWGVCQTRKAPDVGNGPVPDEVWQSWPNDFVFEKFDAREWVRIAKAGGFKYVVIIAKHHDGFHLWDTDYSEFKVTNTPFKRDYLKELADACRAEGMPFGIYYSQRDWYHPDYMPVDSGKAEIQGLNWKLKPGESSPMGDRHAKYNEYQFNVVRELCTKYGKVDIFWWDAAWWGGMFTAEMWDAEKLTRMIRELQPGILMNNRASVPGDFDTPEQRLGSFQDWRPWESCICLTHTWSYSGSPPKSRNEIIRMLVNNACCDGNMLLSWGPKWDGEFAAAEKARLIEVGVWLKENGVAIYGTRGGPWKFGAWGGSTRRGDKAWLHVTQWPTENLCLPVVPNRKVKAARLLNGDVVSFQESGQQITISIPKARQDPLLTIIELTFDQSLAECAAITVAPPSLFDDSVTYGQIVSRQALVTASSRYPADPGDPRLLLAETPYGDFAFHTEIESNPWVKIDLGRVVSVTGLRVLNRSGPSQLEVDRAATLRASVSLDGESWQEVWRAEKSEPLWEFQVTDYVAGAHIPGRKARYIRLELKPASAEYLHLQQVVVFGKID
jgi:alpha-L-fucosidase